MALVFSLVFFSPLKQTREPGAVLGEMKCISPAPYPFVFAAITPSGRRNANVINVKLYSVYVNAYSLKNLVQRGTFGYQAPPLTSLRRECTIKSVSS